MPRSSTEIGPAAWLSHSGFSIPLSWRSRRSSHPTSGRGSGLLATYVFWRYLRSGSWRLACWSGLLLGVAQLTKFTMVVLYGVWPLIALVHHVGRRGRRERTSFRPSPDEGGSDGASPSRNPGWGGGEPNVLGPDESSPSSTSAIKGRRGPAGRWKPFLQALVMVLISLDAINGGYFGRDTCWKLEDFTFASRTLTGTSGHPGNRFRGGWLGRLVVPVPAEYLRGIDAQRNDFESEFPSYLAGQWRTRGWWYYYFYALAVKEPLGDSGADRVGVGPDDHATSQFCSVARRVDRPAAGDCGVDPGQLGRPASITTCVCPAGLPLHRRRHWQACLFPPSRSALGTTVGSGPARLDHGQQPAGLSARDVLLQRGGRGPRERTQPPAR